MNTKEFLLEEELTLLRAENARWREFGGPARTALVVNVNSVLNGKNEPLEWKQKDPNAWVTVRGYCVLTVIRIHDEQFCVRAEIQDNKCNHAYLDTQAYSYTLEGAQKWAEYWADAITPVLRMQRELGMCNADGDPAV